MASLSFPIASFAEEAHTALQEQQEQAAHRTSSGSETSQPSQTHEQIEATEEKLLGHDAHQKLEIAHTLVESNPWIPVAIFVTFVALIALAVRFLIRRKGRS